MSNQDGDRPLFDDEKTQSEHYDCKRGQRQESSNQFTNSQMKDLGYQKWKYRRDPANESIRENDHVHLEGGEKIPAR